MQNNNNFIGIIAMLGYAITSATSSLLIYDANQNITPLLSAFYCFTLCYCFFSIMTLKSSNQFAIKKQYWKEITFLNITTACCWILSFYSLCYIPPDLYLFVYLCSMPISNCLIQNSHYLKAFLLFIGLFFLSTTYHHINNLYFGIALAAIGGASGAFYSLYSKKLVQVFTTNEILSIRFYLIIFLTFIYNIHKNNFHILPAMFYAKFIAIAFISVILPLQFFQIGIKRLSIHQALSYLPLSPFICYLFNLMILQTKFNLIQFITILIISTIMII